jgi:hypothetical protein
VARFLTKLVVFKLILWPVAIAPGSDYRDASLFITFCAKAVSRRQKAHGKEQATG